MEPTAIPASSLTERSKISVPRHAEPFTGNPLTQASDRTRNLRQWAAVIVPAVGVGIWASSSMAGHDPVCEAVTIVLTELRKAPLSEYRFVAALGVVAVATVVTDVFLRLNADGKRAAKIVTGEEFSDVRFHQASGAGVEGGSAELFKDDGLMDTKETDDNEYFKDDKF